MVKKSVVIILFFVLIVFISGCSSNVEGYKTVTIELSLTDGNSIKTNQLKEDIFKNVGGLVLSSYDNIGEVGIEEVIGLSLVKFGFREEVDVQIDKINNVVKIVIGKGNFVTFTQGIDMSIIKF